MSARASPTCATPAGGVVGPGFNDEFGDTFGIIYGFTADGFTHRELRDHVEDMRSRLLQVPDVSKIEILGAQDEEIFVEFSMRQLATLGIDRSALIAALQAQNIVSPAGTVQTGNERLQLRVSGAFESEEDIRAVNFFANGRLIRLRDIAEVHRGYRDPPQPLFRVNGKPAIGLAIAMREGGDILALGRNVERVMHEVIADLPIGIEPVLVADQPQVVEHAIHDFTSSLWQSIAIIMVTSFISLGVRAGTVVALSIPLTIAIVFPIMEFLGIDLQRISLGALIIALGLLVDDAMTTIDVMISRLAAGDSKPQAAAFAYESLAFPMLTGSFITAAGFVPIGFARSSAGEYTFSIFVVVGVTLMISWVVAVVFAPLLGVAILAKPKKAVADKPSMVIRGFRGFLLAAMRMRWLTIGITLACFVVSLLAVPLVPRQFFPPSDRPDLMVDLRLPQNASIYASDEVAARVDKLLAGDPDVAHWTTYVGRGAIRFYLPLDVQLANDFFAQVVVVAKDVAARERLHQHLEAALAENFPGRGQPRLAAGPRPARGLAGAVSRQRPRYKRGARHRPAARRNRERQRGCAPGQFRLDGAGPDGADQHRPGSGTAARSELAGARLGDEHRSDRSACHAGAGRHLSGRSRRARDRRAAGLPCHFALLADPAAKWTHGAAQPGRDGLSSSRSSPWCGAATACRRSPCRPTWLLDHCPRPWSQAWRLRSRN